MASKTRADALQDYYASMDADDPRMQIENERRRIGNYILYDSLPGRVVTKISDAVKAPFRDKQEDDVTPTGIGGYGLRRGGSVKVIGPEHKGGIADEARKRLEDAGYQFTKDGIAAFQRDHDLSESGVVDPSTMGALKGIAAFKKGGRAPAAPRMPPAVPAAPAGGKAGFIQSDVAGRTDRLPTAVPRNSHVIPADVVSGLGQGNSSAGARIIDKILHPHRMKLAVTHRGVKSPPSIFAKRADGGEAGGVPIIVAGGEYIVDPDTVTSIGGGNPNKGHDILDKFITGSRKQTIATMRNLPGPKG